MYSDTDVAVTVVQETKPVIFPCHASRDYALS